MAIIYSCTHNGIMEAIEAAGHSLIFVNGSPIASDERAVQEIIDSFDHLAHVRAIAKARLVEQFNAAMADIESAYPESEKRTFLDQQAEADAVITASLNNSPLPDAPRLTRIASARGVTLLEQAERVKAKADAYNANVDNLIGTRQKLEDQIEAETDWRAVEQINLGV